MARINTKKTLNNDTYYEGGIDSRTINTETIQISPYIADQYDYQSTEDPILLNERKDTAEKIYEIYVNAPFYGNYNDGTQEVTKIPKEDVKKIFEYTLEELKKVKTLSAMEYTIAICEFYSLSYELVVKKVLNSKMMADILEDYYVNMGMAKRMNEVVDNKLF